MDNRVMDEEGPDDFSTNNNKIEVHESENNYSNENCVKKCNKDEIIKRYIEQVHKRRALLDKKNSLLQKLRVVIPRSSIKDSFEKLNYSEKDDESTLRTLLDNLTALQGEGHAALNNNLAKLESMKEEISLKKESLMEQKTSFMEIKEKAALSSVNSKTGERFEAKDVKKLLNQIEEVSKTLEDYQLYSIEKRHNLNLAREKKKNLAEGPINFAKYEMMCNETQNNKEIIQQVSEEIKVIRKKTSTIINSLSHLRQKYLAQEEKTKALNTENSLKIIQSENNLNMMRDHLFQEKMKYTKMKNESKELQHKFTLLQYPELIEDYKAVQQKNEEAHKELQRLKTFYAEEVKILRNKK